LAAFLLHQHQYNTVIQLTHEQIAVELGTAREVISRLLKDFESKGYISLQRGSVFVHNMKALESYDENQTQKERK